MTGPDLTDVLESATEESMRVDMSFLPGQRGGSSAEPRPEVAPSSPPATPPDPPVRPEPADEEVPASLRHTDEQEAIQAGRDPAGGGSSCSGGTTTLPESGFRAYGTDRQLAVRGLPEQVVLRLRAQLRTTAVRELDVEEDEARRFADRLGQASLVMAFLLAQLDLHLDLDPATDTATRLFRSHDPLMGQMVRRMEGLERSERDQTAELDRLQERMREMAALVGAIEHGLAYSIADRTENLARGVAAVGDARLDHRSAVLARDAVREAAARTHRVEAERAGRPIR